MHDMYLLFEIRMTYDIQVSRVFINDTFEVLANRTLRRNEASQPRDRLEKTYRVVGSTL